MKKKRFDVEQIVGVLKQAELGLPVAAVIRKAAISEQTFYRWKAKYAGLEVGQVRQMTLLQEENLRLRKLVAKAIYPKATIVFLKYLRIISSATDFPLITGSEGNSGFLGKTQLTN